MTLSGGQFVGQIAYIADEKAPVSIVAKGSTRIISWSHVKLKTFFKDKADVEPDLAIASARISHGCLNPHGNHRVKIWVRGVATQTPVEPANRSARRNDES
jgi:hypothetical protein